LSDEVMTENLVTVSVPHYMIWSLFASTLVWLAGRLPVMHSAVLCGKIRRLVSNPRNIVYAIHAIIPYGTN